MEWRRMCVNTHTYMHIVLSIEIDNTHYCAYTLTVSIEIDNTGYFCAYMHDDSSVTRFIVHQ